MSEQYQQLVAKLEQIFGPFDAEKRRFANANNSIISRELGYSDSQFSRLINETATEKEYLRANKNVGRILRIRELESQEQTTQPTTPKQKGQLFWMGAAILFFLAFVATLGIYQFEPEGSPTTNVPQVSRDHTLKWAFESSFINPFIRLDDLPADCDFPCYKYQGKWNLQKQYKLPFFRERNGFHYLATDVEMYSRCMTEKSTEGDVIEGYEYQKHEIWYDQMERPIDSFMVNSNTPSEDYQNLDFSKEPGFVKVANIHTFFRNEFSLTDSTIHRIGKVIGRDLEPIPTEELESLIKDKKKLKAIGRELNLIVNNRLKDFSVPIACVDSPLIEANPADIEDGDQMSFQCELTTGGYPIKYVKTYVLVDQYIKNDCMPEVVK